MSSCNSQLALSAFSGTAKPERTLFALSITTLTSVGFSSSDCFANLPISAESLAPVILHLHQLSIMALTALFWRSGSLFWLIEDFCNSAIPEQRKEI